jgi:glycosyltransferase involved in cell wall biosynthesis
MKLAYICNEYPPAAHGGIGTFIYTIAHAFRRGGHDVTVVGWGDRAGARDDDGVRVVTLERGRIPGVSWLTDRIKLYFWLKREVAAGRCDLIEVPDYEGWLPFPFAACPVVVRLHLSLTAISRAVGGRPPTGAYIAEYLTHRFHRRWIAVSEHALRLTVSTFGLEPDETSTIYYPIVSTTPPLAPPARLPDRFVMFAGYVCARKGAYTVAQAARLFLPLYPDLHVVFLGELPVEEGVSADRRIAGLVGPALATRVHCQGRVSREMVLACLARAAVFTFPSRLENNPLVVGEAMLSGVPVITSTCDPFPEYLTHERTGLLVPPDDPVALSGAVCRVLDSPTFASGLVSAARELVAARFSLPACVEASAAFYGDGADPGRRERGSLVTSQS